MGWTNAVVLFVIVWWVTFLMALPFGVHPPERPDPGHAESAPERPLLWIKAVAATAVAGAVTAIVGLLVAYDVVDFRSFLFGTAP